MCADLSQPEGTGLDLSPRLAQHDDEHGGRPADDVILGAVPGHDLLLVRALHHESLVTDHNRLRSLLREVLKPLELQFKPHDLCLMDDETETSVGGGATVVYQTGFLEVVLFFAFHDVIDP